jgi:transglutaminase-like putative cysteine protease
MFALDWPAEAPPGASIAPGQYLWSGQAIRSPRNYNVISFPEIADKELHPREREMYLEVPNWVSPAVRQLARSWTAGATSQADVINRGLAFFQSQHFTYSLTPGQYQPNDLDEFLFRRRTGFCEHYAGSFATLMRLAGIPSRVVVGYLGGEYNEIGRFFVVRQIDSHAWCEVWLPDLGWQRVDPTSVVAPDRLTLGLRGFLEQHPAAATTPITPGIIRTLAGSTLFTNLRQAWQAANYAWDTQVLSFDETAQISLFNSFNAFARGPLSTLFGAMTAVCVLLAIWFGWIRFRFGKTRDRLKIGYARFCLKLARLGVARFPTEGPSDFATRAARLLPDRSERIDQVSVMYIALRYAPDRNPDLELRFRREVKAFG